MLALKLAKKIVTQNGARAARASLSMNKVCRRRISSQPAYTASILTFRRKFHASHKPRWSTPEDLSTSELRRECERRELLTSGSRQTLVNRLKDILKDAGGYDNGLTTDASLVSKKREIETSLNRIPDKHHSVATLYVEDRYQKKIFSKFEDERVKFHSGANSHVKLEGRYADICHLRSQISQSVAEIAARETIYSLPHHIVLRLKRSILADIRRTHDVNFSIMRHKHNGEDMMLVTVEGDIDKRVIACEALEEVVNRIKTHSLEVPGVESYANNPKSLAKADDPSFHPSMLRESVADCFNVFEGILLYLDPRMREMMHDYQGRLDAIGVDTNTNIYLGNRDLFWLNEFQLGIEGTAKDVSNARQQIDQLMNHLKSLTLTMVLPPEINDDMAKESKQLATTIQKQLGVDTVIIQQNDHIYVHLIGTTVQVSAAACIIDSRTHRLHKLKGSDAERLRRRERIRNLNFLEYGVGGLDDTLRDMLRRTFESRLISNRLRNELDLQHVRGVLLHGPPGTGKTLIARKISEILGCDEPKIVNGPEVESKWVGEAEKNIRTLFEDAQTDFEEKGEDAALHVIIFDEIDAIAKKRGGAHAKSRDGALNQLLCCLDGVTGLDNVLVFGLTNRKDCLDPALLRPGRLEVQLEIGLPDAKGRLDILEIHTKKMQSYGRLENECNLKILAEYADEFSGADIAGMVRSAVSYALEDHEDEDNVIVTQGMLQRGLDEIRFAKENLPTDDDPESNVPGLLQA